MATISTILNIAALEAYSSPAMTGTVLFVQGYSSYADGGEGNFHLTATTGGTTDYGTIIIDAMGREWVRDTSGAPYNAKWFGATGGGTLDDTLALQHAINAAQSPAGSSTGKLLLIPAGTYLISASLEITQTIKIIGEGQFNTYITTSALSDDNITITSNNIFLDGVEISDIQLDATGAKTAGYGISILSTNGGHSARCTFRDITMSGNMFGGMNVQVGFDLVLQNISISGVGTGSYGFLFKGVASNIAPVDVWVRDCRVQGTTNASAIGMMIDAYSQGFYVSGCVMETDLNVGLQIDNTSSDSTASPFNLFFSQFICDTNQGSACLIKCVLRAYFESCWFCGAKTDYGVWNLGSGYGGSRDVSLVNCVILGNAQSGIRIDSTAQWTRIENCTLERNSFMSPGTYSGVAIQANATDVTIVGNTIGFNDTTYQKYSVWIDSGSGDRFIVANNNLRGYTALAISDSSTGTNKIMSPNIT
ncbi:MAG TPA: glycosyl hydrolase family 28-related protein [Rhizomicrobium sp.]|nr:glycosyl hydrolase family 28-related protein [Rhizomicrobium sp.]